MTVSAAAMIEANAIAITTMIWSSRLGRTLVIINFLVAVLFMLLGFLSNDGRGSKG